MTYKAQNPEYNMTIAEAAGFKNKLAALGIVSGDLHVNGQAAGEMADYIPVEDAGLEADGRYNIVARINGDWHNVAILKREFGGGTVEEFKRVCADCRMDEKAALLNIPGAATAIAALIAKA